MGKVDISGVVVSESLENIITGEAVESETANIRSASSTHSFIHETRQDPCLTTKPTEPTRGAGEIIYI